MFNLNFDTPELQFPCHPRHEALAARIKLELAGLGLTDHFIVFSSGTTSSDLKGYALSRKALLINAQAVNEHFKLSKDDVWGLSLPYFHVGGLSVIARAHVLGSRLVDLGLWSPLEWNQKLLQEGVTITTVVPAQVFDLVQNNLHAPSNLKYLVVGGDFLSSELAKKAQDLGWPLIRTFGMTEVCSQLASSSTPHDPVLKVLPIHQVKINTANQLLVKGESLFTLEFKLRESLEVTYASDLCDEDGFYLTRDLASINEQTLTPLGRMDDQIKVGGKLLSMNSLKEILYEYALRKDCYGKVELSLEADDRMGKKLIVMHLPNVQIPADLFSPLKFTLKEVNSFDRTDLGKLKK
ncbi:MAG TPA: AMP-binding protein [Bacteriovoracaceae bacterium]|nr:AMP-binding protein [Bacteriovoracaceae bacterium]